MAKKKESASYSQIISTIFFNHYKKGMLEFEFNRTEFAQIAKKIGVEVPKNLGDVIYSFRYRKPLPDKILATAPKGKAWTIELAGHGGKYKFKLASSKTSNILPRTDLATIKVPDATPEIIKFFPLNDEQGLLAKLRYNRLIDIFLGMATYSLQNHLRTTVKGIGQIEIDEIYAGVNKKGEQFVIPVQAKGGSDKLGAVQTIQDIACCKEKYPKFICRAISAQFMEDGVIALFELGEVKGEIKVIEEKHYELVPASEFR
jgi:hypothetical protein